MKDQRYSELKKMLEDRRREIEGKRHEHLQDIRANSKEKLRRNPGDSDLDVDIQDEIEMTLVQMESETLARIDAALNRLEEDAYGACAECGGEISDRRLRALPFAIRCKECEESREKTSAREKQLAQQKGGSMLAFPLFLE